MIPGPPRSTLFPYTTLFRSLAVGKFDPVRLDVPPGNLAVGRNPEASENFGRQRSEEHTSELQSHLNLVCRLLLEKKNTMPTAPIPSALSSHTTTHTTSSPSS